MPCASSSMSSESPSHPGNVTWAMCGSRCSGPACGSPLTMASGTAVRMPSTSRARSASRRADSSVRRPTVTSTAAAKAAMAAVLSVPERRSRSCPPPCSSGIASSSRRMTSAPTPIGPPSLCDVTVIASRPLAAKSTGRCPTAWTASLWTGMSYAEAMATTSAIGWTVPDLVVRPHAADERDVGRVALELRAEGVEVESARASTAARSTSRALVLREPDDGDRAGRGARRTTRSPGAATDPSCGVPSTGP